MKTTSTLSLLLLAASAAPAMAAEFSYSTVINVAQGTRYSEVPPLSCSAQVAMEINIKIPETMAIVSVRGLTRNNSRCETRVDLRGAAIHALAFETNRNDRDFLFSNSADLPVVLAYSYPFDGRCDGAVPADATATLALGIGEMWAPLRSQSDIRFAINSFSGSAEVNAKHGSSNAITLETPIALSAKMHWNAMNNRLEGIRGFVQF